MKLTEPQKQMLVAVGLGCVVHYERDSFFRNPTSFLGNVCPRLASATSSGRVLRRIGLIKPYNPEAGGYHHAVLTEAGQTMYEGLLTEEQKIALDKHRAYQVRQEELWKINKARNAFHTEHREVINQCQDKLRDLSHEEHRLNHEMQDIARKIAFRANDAAELTGRLHQIGDRLKQMADESASAKALMPHFPGDESN